ncbi:MAG: hypothetical protein KKB79_01635 [Nanoarchaeota archaeon]|nr:hypothetical protein [Nanoarchaeota archaeon]
MPKTWPVARKGTKYVVRPNFSINDGVPVLVLLRDMLKVAQNRKEVKTALREKKILLNTSPVFEEKNNILLFDTITIVPSNKYYKMSITDKGKFDVEEIDEKDSTKKVAKIVDKKILKGKKIQLNLSDGRNFLSDIKCRMGDSAVINFKENKITECVPFSVGSNAIVVAGKYSGKKGLIKNIHEENKSAELESNGEIVNVLIKQMMAVENGKSNGKTCKE